MFQWNTRIATVFIVSAAIATTAAAQPQHKQGGGAPAARPAPAAPAPHAAPPPHAAPAPRAAPAPQASAPRAAPQMAAPRAAPHIAAPRHAPPQASAQRAAPQPQRAAPRQLARPPGGPPAWAMARPAPTPRTSAAPTQQQPQTAGRGGRGGARLAQPTQPSPRTNVARPSPMPGTAATVGAAAAGAAAAAHIGRNGAPQQNVNPQAPANRNPQTAASPRALSGGVLRNQAFANLSAARDPNARMLARSTFEGRFFDPQWRRRFAHPIVFGWVGPLFWPYAYDDFVDYTFYPYAYDTFWPYAYDDFYDGMFGAYAHGYGGTYASVERPQGSRYAAVGGREGPRGGRSVGADLCSGQTAGLTDWPIERAVRPDGAQRSALKELQDATSAAVNLLSSDCPTYRALTPVGRLQAMEQRLDAMLRAVQTVEPALEKFYGSLGDEQKERFNRLSPTQG